MMPMTFSSFCLFEEWRGEGDPDSVGDQGGDSIPDRVRKIVVTYNPNELIGGKEWQITF